jgi:hypothetical protein
MPMQVLSVAAISEPVPRTAPSCASAMRCSSPVVFHHAAEGHRAEDQPDGVEHAGHAAAGQQFVQRGVAGFDAV